MLFSTSILMKILVIFITVEFVFIVIKLFKPHIFIKAGHDAKRSQDFAVIDRKVLEDLPSGAIIRKLGDDDAPLGRVVVKEGKTWVEMPLRDSDGMSGKIDFRKVGRIDGNGIVYRVDNDVETIAGYLAKPSDASSPTIQGERSFNDHLWMNSRLDAYIGIPESMRPSPVRAQASADTKERDDVFNQDFYKEHRTVIDGIVRNMIFVDGGTFKMGVDANDEGRKDYLDKISLDEKPVHKVTLSSYYIGKYPVTNLQWRTIMGDGGDKDLSEDDYPVAPVSWDECSLFIKRLSLITGLDFSLPTEAQWEYAARGGNRSMNYIYSGGDVLTEVACNTPKAKVGSKGKANELGIYDMSGLVREWCSDWFAPYPSEDQIDPVGPEMPLKEDERRHVVRSPRGNETVTSRKGELPNCTDPDEKGFKSYGFRIVCPYVPADWLMASNCPLKPVWVGQCRMNGYGILNTSESFIPDVARGAAFSILFGLEGGNTELSEYCADNTYSKNDTALLASIVYSVLFLIMYFINVGLFQMPILLKDRFFLTNILILYLFYYVIWVALHFWKTYRTEQLNTIQPIIDNLDKSLGVRYLDVLIVVLGFLAAFFSLFYFDYQFVPLIMAIVTGCLVNMTVKGTRGQWKIDDPYKVSSFDGTKNYDDSKTFEWSLTSMDNRDKVKGHITLYYNSEDIKTLRLQNPFFLETKMTPKLYDSYIDRMRNYLKEHPDTLENVRLISDYIDKISRKFSLSELEKVQFTMDFVQQAIEYADDAYSVAISEPLEYMRYPDETLFDKCGDCDCKSFLACELLLCGGYDVLFMQSRKLKHIAIAIRLPEVDYKNEIYDVLYPSDESENKTRYEDIVVGIGEREYVFCETSRDCYIGEIPSGESVEDYETKKEFVNNVEK